MTEKTRLLLPSLSLTLAVMLWASSFVVLKIAFTAYHPMQVMFGRMFIASLCSLVFLPAFRHIRWRRRDLKYLLLLGICEPCLYFYFEARALELTSASQAGVITAMLPLLVAMLAWLWLKEQIRPQTLGGFVLAIIGASWLSLAGQTSAHAPNPLLGNLYEFIAMACAAAYTVALKHLVSYYPPLLLTAFQTALGSLFFLPFLLHPAIGWNLAWQGIPSLLVIYLGICVTLGAYALYNYGVRSVPASRAAGFINLIPVFSVLLGMVVLGETLNLGQWLACGLVFCGVWLSSRRSPSPALQPVT